MWYIRIRWQDPDDTQQSLTTLAKSDEFFSQSIKVFMYYITFNRHVEGT